MQQIIARTKLRDEVILRLGESPVVTLLRARQVGKTTLARQVQEQVGTATVFDLESPTGRAALDSTPELALRDCEGLVMIDEVQRMPALFEILRPICDDTKRRANFLLLGSASPELVRGISESLAGRTQFIAVPGFGVGEVGGEEQNRLWLRGGERCPKKGGEEDEAYHPEVAAGSAQNETTIAIDQADSRSQNKQGAPA